jgi:hypothetical protein
MQVPDIRWISPAFRTVMAEFKITKPIQMIFNILASVFIEILVMPAGLRKYKSHVAR